MLDRMGRNGSHVAARLIWETAGVEKICEAVFAGIIGGRRQTQIAKIELRNSSR